MLQRADALSHICTQIEHNAKLSKVLGFMNRYNMSIALEHPKGPGNINPGRWNKPRVQDIVEPIPGTWLLGTSSMVVLNIEISGWLH
jgi:hypothetical protein